MRKSIIAATTAALVTLAGCATTGYASGTPQSGWGASSDAPYQFAVPDDGTTLNGYDPVGMNRSLYAMLEPLSGEERKYMADVFFTVSKYEGCIKHGYPSAVAATNVMLSHRSPASCRRNIHKIYQFSGNTTKTYLTLGRPDNHIEKTYTSLAQGSRNVGWSDIESWQKFVGWTGAELDGKTRTDIITQFHELTGGQYTGPRNQVAETVQGVVADQVMETILDSIF